jgi:negative regulator of replication initiation
MNAMLNQIAPDLLQTLASQATARGLSVDDYLRQMLGIANGDGTPPPVSVENGKPQPAPANKKLTPAPMPNKDREMQWLVDHAREYAGQWVALDGDRLIAQGPDAKAVYAAARADGAYLPMVTQVEDPDRIFIF